MAQKAITPAAKLIVIGGSAGSLDVLLHVLPGIAPDPACAMIVVLHRRNDYESQLPDLLKSRTAWMVKEAEDKETITGGVLYVAPADYHLLAEQDFTLSLDCSEKVHYSRPSIDLTFETAGDAYGSKALCLLLSGGNEDGAEGMKHAATRGSHIAVQQPEEAAMPLMPQSALRQNRQATILRTAQMSRFIREFMESADESA